MKLGIIGLGDIAAKAYMPVYSSQKDVEFHLYTRNQAKLSITGEKYRFNHLHESIDSIIDSGIKGAFVHSATESHEEIVRLLLSKGIHVYVDKPITYHYDTAKSLVDLAKTKQLLLMTGFNRRYAPSYQKLKELENPNMIIMQKNRKSLPDQIRRFVFDDFIHVVDTILYLFPDEIESIIVNGRKQDGVLYHVVVQFISSGATAIGIMNRDSGTVEEKVEVMSSEEKRAAYNVSDIVIYKDKNETKLGMNDWEPTLHKRGFYQIADDFIQALRTGEHPSISMHGSLLTHQICEKVVEELEKI